MCERCTDAVWTPGERPSTLHYVHNSCHIRRGSWVERDVLFEGKINLAGGNIDERNIIFTDCHDSL